MQHPLPACAAPHGRSRGPAQRRSRILLALALAASAASSVAAPLAYVLGGGPAALQVLDAASDSVVATVPLAAGPVALSVVADGSRVFVANAGSPSITVVDGTSHGVLATLPLAGSPTALAAAPDGSRLYVLMAGGLVQALDAAEGAVLGSVTVSGAAGLAVSPDGQRLYLAAGGLQVVDTATLSPAGSVPFGADQWSTGVVVSSDGQRAWLTHQTGLFSGGVTVVDTARLAVHQTLELGALPGRIALTPDGSRAYVGVQATWVDTGYGAGFFPGRSVLAIDALQTRVIGQIDLGAEGSNWSQQNTPGGLAVTPDRASVFIAVPRLARVAAAEVNTHQVRTLVPVASPGPVAAAQAGLPLLPYRVEAVDDTAPATPLGGTVLASVLANDRLGGMTPSTGHVRLRQLSASHPGLQLDTRTGAIKLKPGAPLGSYTLAYRLCERASPANCDDGEVLVNVTPALAIDAADDTASAYPGTASAANVLTNDRLGGSPATAANARLKLLASSQEGLTLNTATGVVAVATGTPLGTHRLRYRLCEAAVAANCDTATVTVSVSARPVVAADDTATAPRTGGRVLDNVRGNDTLAGLSATPANTTLAMTATSHPGLALNLADGSVTVAAGMPAGAHSLDYRLCESASPSNCDDATVRVTVAPYLVDAVDDSARASSKRAGTALASVLWNDRFAGRPASAADVTMQQVSLTPANPQIRFDTVDGSVDILGKTQSGEYRLVYRICEVGNGTNCDQATVLLDLSGGD